MTALAFISRVVGRTSAVGLPASVLNGEHIKSVPELIYAAYGISLQQAVALSVGIACMTGLSLLLHMEAWLALFALMFFPVCAVSLIMLACQKWLPFTRNWTVVWLLLVILIIVTSFSSAAQYWAWTKVSLVAMPPILACVFSSLAFSLLSLCLPLWKIQTEAHAFQLANLKAAAVTAELKALQAQIEPHFLYNTLSNARYLARHEPEKAVRMLDHLIAYLQRVLPDMRSTMSSLERECEVAGHYLALMAIRFGERMQFRIELPDALKRHQVPPLMLMTLIENAIQHGVEPKPGTVQVILAASERHGKLYLSVSDDGAGPGSSMMGTGVGLRNLRERLSAQYGNAAEFSLQRSDAGMTIAEIVLPLK